MDSPQLPGSIPDRMARLAGRRDLPTTEWSDIADASARTPSGRAALSRLVTLCWYPLYAYARRWGKSPSQAEDLTQGFLARLIRGDSFVRAAPRLVAEAKTASGTRRPRFRPWLLHSFRNHLSDGWKAEGEQPAPKAADSRRAELPAVDVDIASSDRRDAECRYARELPIDEDADSFVERLGLRGALFLAHDTLRSEWYEAGKGPRFEVLKRTIERPMTQADYEQFAPELGTTPNALKQDAYRLRNQFHDKLEGLLDDERPLPSHP